MAVTRIIGNLCAGPDIDVKTFINYGLLPSMKAFLDRIPIKDEIIKELMWIASNIAACKNESFIGKLFEYKIIDKAIDILKTSQVEGLIQESEIIVSHCCNHGGMIILKKLVELGIIGILLNVMRVHSNQDITVRGIDVYLEILTKCKNDDDIRLVLETSGVHAFVLNVITSKYTEIS